MRIAGLQVDTERLIVPASIKGKVEKRRPDIPVPVGSDVIARLKPIPDLQVGVAWRNLRVSNDNAVRLGASIPIPVWDQNLGAIAEAQESRAKVEAEPATAKAALVLTLGRAYETLVGAGRDQQPRSPHPVGVELLDNDPVE